MPAAHTAKHGPGGIAGIRVEAFDTARVQRVANRLGVTWRELCRRKQLDERRGVAELQSYVNAFLRVGRQSKGAAVVIMAASLGRVMACQPEEFLDRDVEDVRE